MCSYCVIFFSDSASTEIYTLSLHDALPILQLSASREMFGKVVCPLDQVLKCICLRLVLPRQIHFSTWSREHTTLPDRKSTRLNSSHSSISYAVFCLKKKKRCELRARTTTSP